MPVLLPLQTRYLYFKRTVLSFTLSLSLSSIFLPYRCCVYHNGFVLAGAVVAPPPPNNLPLPPCHVVIVVVIGALALQTDIYKPTHTVVRARAFACSLDRSPFRQTCKQIARSRTIFFAKGERESESDVQNRLMVVQTTAACSRLKQHHKRYI